MVALGETLIECVWCISLSPLELVIGQWVATMEITYFPISRYKKGNYISRSELKLRISVLQQ